MVTRSRFRLGRLVACATLAFAATAPAFADLPWWDWLFPPKLRMVCPVACPGTRTCTIMQYTSCNSGSATRCICVRVPPTGVLPP